jgi:hypothetical protein
MHRSKVSPHSITSSAARAIAENRDACAFAAFEIDDQLELVDL